MTLPKKNYVNGATISQLHLYSNFTETKISFLFVFFSPLQTKRSKNKTRTPLNKTSNFARTKKKKKIKIVLSRKGRNKKKNPSPSRFPSRLFTSKNHLRSHRCQNPHTQTHHPEPQIHGPSHPFHIQLLFHLHCPVFLLLRILTV